MTLLLHLKSVIVRHQNQAFFSFISQRQRVIHRGMKAYIQIIGQNSPEGPPSLLVHYDNQRYLFNCREGTQRLCVQEKARLGKLSNVFLTRVNWECMGGLTGMLLTLTDAGIRKIDVHGGKNLTHFIAATRNFVYRTNSKVSVHEYEDQSKPYSDKNLTITPVIIEATSSKKRNFDEFSEENSSSSGSESDTPANVQRFKKGPELTEREALEYRQKVVSYMFTDAKKGEKAPGHTIEAECSPRDSKIVHPLSAGEKKNTNQREYLMKVLPKAQPYPSTISYICQGTPAPRKFNKSAAEALGVKPGPVYGQLQKGKSVTLDDGRVITQDMVCDPEIPGHVFIVVDCPSPSFIDGLIRSKKFDTYKKGGSNIANVIVHFAREDVLQDPSYKAWMNSFDESTDHIFGATDICAQTVQFASHAVGQVKLSMLNEQFFPIPQYSNTPKIALEEFQGLPKNSHVLKNMAQYSLEPRTGIQYLNRVPFNHTDFNNPYIKEIHEDGEYNAAVQLARTEAAKVDVSEKFPGDDVEIITLGTGSSIPGKYRNVSATLVKIPKYGSVMLDAGEGTYGQMMRRFGMDNLDEEIRKLKCIFISHLHADHHLGVVQLITKWIKLTHSDKSCLTIIGPYVYKNWLLEYNGIEYLGLGKKLKFIRNESILVDRTPKGRELAYFEGLKKAMGLSVVEPVEVEHCRWAYGLSMVHESGWKLVYSGDTRPCNRLVARGKDATVLIHEATLEDAEKEKAIAKKHTTTGEAVEVGQKMNARFTLLNHFSQRYPKVPVLSEEQSNVCFSFDLMTVPIKYIPVLPKYKDAIQLAFKGEEEAEPEEPSKKKLKSND